MFSNCTFQLTYRYGGINTPQQLLEGAHLKFSIRMDDFNLFTLACDRGGIRLQADKLLPDEKKVTARSEDIYSF